MVPQGRQEWMMSRLQVCGNSILIQLEPQQETIALKALANIDGANFAIATNHHVLAVDGN